MPGGNAGAPSPVVRGLQEGYGVASKFEPARKEARFE